jgi:RimJ/RimL family protein N-acetyltransferase
MILQGNGLVLRPLVPDDAAMTLAWRQGERAQYLNAGAQTVEQQWAWIHAHQHEANFVIWHPDPPRPIGTISLYNVDARKQTGDLGREMLAYPMPGWVVAEVEKTLLDYAFGDRALRQVRAWVVAGNERVVGMRQFFGWHLDGVVRDDFLKDGAFDDVVLLSLMAEEYRQDARGRYAERAGRRE